MITVRDHRLTIHQQTMQCKEYHVNTNITNKYSARYIYFLLSPIVSGIIVRLRPSPSPRPGLSQNTKH